MSINERSTERCNGAHRDSLQPHHNSTLQPCYEFYRQGITESHKGWIEVINASIRNARGRILIAVVAVLALSKVACEFLEKGSNNLSYRSIIGALLIALMILVVGLISLRRVKDTNVGQKEDREKDKVESAEFGVSGNSSDQDRRTSARDGGSDIDGGCE